MSTKYSQEERNFYVQDCINEAKNKGTTIRAYAKAHNLCSKTLYSWITRTGQPAKNQGFVKLESKTKVIKASTIKATYNGAQFEIPENCIELFMKAVSRLS